MDLVSLVIAISYLGVFGIIFAETGFLFGFFLPGDSLLIALGLVSATGRLDLSYGLLAVFAGSLLGHNLGYIWGRALGPTIEKRVDAERYQKARELYQRFGLLTITLGPFIPYVRPLIPFMAGAFKVRWVVFFLLNLVGTLAWTQGITLAAYWVARRVPWFQTYLEESIITVVAVALVLGVVLELARRQKQQQA